MYDKTVKTCVIALGYFDSVHIGHRRVIDTAVKIAEHKRAKCIVFSFDGNLRAFTVVGEEKYVYSAEERKSLILKRGVDEVLFLPVTRDFLSKDKKEFLEYLNSTYDITDYVCGEDYRFGRNGDGDVAYLQEYAAAHKQRLTVAPTERCGKEKISTGLIKSLLADGDVAKANELLGENYFVTGVVVRDRGVGRRIGFPTVNIRLESDRVKLKDGVYYGRATENGATYTAIINYGKRPTYGLSERLIEAHLIGFDGELYGQTVRIVFDGYIRDIMKFTDENALIKQLKADEEFVKNTRELSARDTKENKGETN